MFCIPQQVLWEVGVAMMEGQEKYGRFNYRASGVRASVYVDAAMGHIQQFVEGEDLDKDSGLSHVTKAITSLIVLRDAMMNDFWTDDRPPKIKDLDELRDFLQTKVQENFERHEDKDPHHYTDIDDGAPYRETDDVSVDDELKFSKNMVDTIVKQEVEARVAEERSRAELTAKRAFEDSLGTSGVLVEDLKRVGAVEERTRIYTDDAKVTNVLSKVVAEDDWNAKDSDIEDDELLKMAAATPTIKAIPPLGVTVAEATEGLRNVAKSVNRGNEPSFEKYKELLDDTTWAPADPIPQERGR